MLTASGKLGEVPGLVTHILYKTQIKFLRKSMFRQEPRCPNVETQTARLPISSPTHVL
jgi:hypothetical protein